VENFMKKGSCLMVEQCNTMSERMKVVMNRDDVRERMRIAHIGKKSVERHSDATKKLMAEKARERWVSGMYDSDESRRRRSESHIGNSVRHSEETRMKIGIANSKPKRVKHHSDVISVTLGYWKYITGARKTRCVFSDERKLKMSQKYAGRKVHQNTLDAIHRTRGVRRSHLSMDHRMKIAIASTLAWERGNRGCWKAHIYCGVAFRSTWERRIAQWLDSQNICWKYEGVENIVETSFGPYVPDFTLANGLLVEVKGSLISDRQEKKIDWCVANGYDVRVVDETNISNISLDKRWSQRQTERMVVLEEIL
jgi:hypothetical protein